MFYKDYRRPLLKMESSIFNNEGVNRGALNCDFPFLRDQSEQL